MRRHGELSGEDEGEDAREVEGRRACKMRVAVEGSRGGEVHGSQSIATVEELSLLPEDTAELGKLETRYTACRSPPKPEEGSITSSC